MLQVIAHSILPAPLHRVGLRLAHRLRHQWWRWRRPDLEACRVLALDAEGRVLLVRHSYGSGHWMPPGGGMARGEDPVLAGLRELGEELGCGLDQPRIIDLTVDTLHGAGNRVHIILGLASGAPQPDQREIIAAQFFALEALPDDLALGLDEALPRWLAFDMRQEGQV